MALPGSQHLNIWLQSCNHTEQQILGWQGRQCPVPSYMCLVSYTITSFQPAQFVYITSYDRDCALRSTVLVQCPGVLSYVFTLARCSVYLFAINSHY